MSFKDLSDEELKAEMERRRRARNRAAGRSASRPSPTFARRSPKHDPEAILRYYANLELEPGSSLSKIEAAYERLSKQYHPDKHKDDAEKHRAATELAASLTDAYRALVEYKRSR